jgi:hypothetical protein
LKLIPFNHLHKINLIFEKRNLEKNQQGFSFMLSPTDDLFHCSICEEKQPNGKRGFCSSSECAHCYVESKVDGLLDMMDEREKYTKRCKPEVYYSGEYAKVRNDVLTRRMWILQTGGTTQRRDERLHNQLVEAFERMDQLLEEHPDELEYED